MQFTEIFWNKFINILNSQLDLLIQAFDENFSEYTKIREADMMKNIELDVEPFFNKLNTFSGKRNHTSLTLSWMVCVDECHHLNKVLNGCKWSFLVHLNRAARLIPIGSVFIFIDTLADLKLLDPKKAFPD